MQAGIVAADEHAIRNLLSRYAHLLGGRKPDAFAALFADDALLSAAGNGFRLCGYFQHLAPRPQRIPRKRNTQRDETNANNPFHSVRELPPHTDEADGA